MTPTPQSANDNVALLLRCPFCGGAPASYRSDYISSVICQSCGAAMQRPNRDGAIPAWQARPSPPADAPAQGESVDHRKIGCLIHDAIKTTLPKHLNVIRIYDAIKPYLAPVQPVNAMLVEALNHAILFLESSLQGQLGAFVNAMREEELPYLRNVALTAAQQPGAGVDGWQTIDSVPHLIGEQFLTSDGEMIIPSEAIDAYGIYHHNITCHTSIKDYRPTHWMPLPATPKPTSREG